jgi:chitinase
VRRSLAVALVAAAAAIAAAAAAGAAGPPTPAPVVAAYFAAFDPTLAISQIDAARLTDVIYAFGAIDDQDRCALGEPGADPANFAQLAALKASDPGLETELSIGGWSGSDRFSDAASTAAKRATLVRSCIDLFLRRWPGLFDGFDIDWEFPVAGGARTTPARAADRANATALLAEFRSQLDALGAVTHRHYLLTAAMPAFGTAGAPGYDPLRSWDLAAIARIVDWVNLMTYDLTGPSSPVTDFESALYPTPAASTPAPPAAAGTIDGAVRYYESAGVPADEIVIGAPFYGHVFVGVHSVDDGLFQRFRKLGADPSYAQIEAMQLPPTDLHWSPYAQEPWIYDRRNHTFLSYDDPAAMTAKAQYAVAHHLRGVMLWELGMDDASHSLLDALSAPMLAGGA